MNNSYTIRKCTELSEHDNQDKITKQLRLTKIAMPAGSDLKFYGGFQRIRRSPYE